MAYYHNHSILILPSWRIQLQCEQMLYERVALIWGGIHRICYLSKAAELLFYVNELVF